MGTFLSATDLVAFADISAPKADLMIEDAEAHAVLAAPCITATGFTKTAAVRAILRGAILRWNDAGSGALQSEQAGMFGRTLDTRQERRGMFWPTEIVQLQSLCAGAEGGTYTVSIAGPAAPVV